eukprot:1196372-Prorocentrum_minimum.AAC.4
MPPRPLCTPTLPGSAGGLKGVWRKFVGDLSHFPPHLPPLREGPQQRRLRHPLLLVALPPPRGRLAGRLLAGVLAGVLPGALLAVGTFLGGLVDGGEEPGQIGLDVAHRQPPLEGHRGRRRAELALALRASHLHLRRKRIRRFFPIRFSNGAVGVR